MRRYTRRTKALSKKLLNLQCALAVYMVHYNFGRPHHTLTKAAHGKPAAPAIAAGLAERPWSWEQVVQLLESREETARDVGRRRKDRR